MITEAIDNKGQCTKKKTETENQNKKNCKEKTRVTKNHVYNFSCTYTVNIM